MPQAIVTKYLPCTNHKGSRIKAACDRGSVTVSYDPGARNPHEDAARALIRKFLAEDEKQYGTKPSKNPWRGPWMEGELPGNKGSVFVFVFADDSFEVAP